MMIFVTTLHIFLCIMLVLVILLQPGKGGDVAAAFGGGASSTLFGPRGPASLLTNATTVVAILFMSTSIVLAVDASNKRKGTGDDLEDDIQRFEQEEASKDAGAPAAPGAPILPIEPPPLEVPSAPDGGADGTSPPAPDGAAPAPQSPEGSGSTP